MEILQSIGYHGSAMDTLVGQCPHSQILRPIILRCSTIDHSWPKASRCDRGVNMSFGFMTPISPSLSYRHNIRSSRAQRCTGQQHDGCNDRISRDPGRKNGWYPHNAIDDHVRLRGTLEPDSYNKDRGWRLTDVPQES